MEEKDKTKSFLSIHVIKANNTFNRLRSDARLLRIPPTKASPAPVVSTGFTFTPPTLPLNSCIECGWCKYPNETFNPVKKER